MSVAHSEEGKNQQNENENPEGFVILIKRFIPLLLVLALLIGLWLFYRYGCEGSKPMPIENIQSIPAADSQGLNGTISDTLVSMH